MLPYQDKSMQGQSAKTWAHHLHDAIRARLQGLGRQLRDIEVQSGFTGMASHVAGFTLTPKYRAERPRSKQADKPSSSNTTVGTAGQYLLKQPLQRLPSRPNLQDRRALTGLNTKTMTGYGGITRARSEYGGGFRTTSMVV